MGCPRRETTRLKRSARTKPGKLKISVHHAAGRRKRFFLGGIAFLARESRQGIELTPCPLGQSTPSRILAIRPAHGGEFAGERNVRPAVSCGRNDRWFGSALLAAGSPVAMAPRIIACAVLPAGAFPLLHCFVRALATLINAPPPVEIRLDLRPTPSQPATAGSLGWEAGWSWALAARCCWAWT